MASTFADLGASAGAGNFPAADDGVYLCVLMDIEQTQMGSFNDPTIMEPKLRFVFEAIEEEDENGKSFRFTKITGIGFGADRAGLTQIIDGMFGKRLTADEFAALDLDELKARKWRVNVEMFTNEKGYDKNRILSVKPAGQKGKGMPGQKPAPKPLEPDEDDLSDTVDPFAE